MKKEEITEENPFPDPNILMDLDPLALHPVKKERIEDNEQFNIE